MCTVVNIHVVHDWTSLKRRPSSTLIFYLVDDAGVKCKMYKNKM